MSFFWIEALGKPFVSYRVSPLFHWKATSDYFNKTALDLSRFFSELIKQSQNHQAGSLSQVIVSRLPSLDSTYIDSVAFRGQSNAIPASLPFLAILCGGRKEDQTLSYATFVTFYYFIYHNYFYYLDPIHFSLFLESHFSQIHFYTGSTSHLTHQFSHFVIAHLK